MSEEIFDVCDEDDNVISQASRSDVHACRLLHRAVHIWVWNTKGELLIHLRSEQKDEYPNCFTSSASGHLNTGEDYEAAAHRELQEELQLQGELKFIKKLPASAATAFEHTALYFLHSDDVPVADPEEIAELHYLTVEQLSQMVESHPDQFTPPFRSLYEWWQSASAEEISQLSS